MGGRRQRSKQERMRIYKLFDGHCAYCGRHIEYGEMQLDHIQPLYRGGTDEEDNLFPACRSCNKYKSTYTVEEFRKQLSKLPERYERDVSTFKMAERFSLVSVKKTAPTFYFERESMKNLLTLMEDNRNESRYRKDYPEFHEPIRESLTFGGREIDWEGPLGKRLLGKLGEIPITAKVK